MDFPRTLVAGVSLPRMLIGTNWMLGWSHTSASADRSIKERFAKPEDFFPVLSAFLEYGIDAVMGPIANEPLMRDAIEYARQKTGKDLIIIDTPIINVSDSTEARREAEAVIRKCAAGGAVFCLPHHSSVEQLVNKNKASIERIGDYTAMIRDAGMIPGLSAHMPELVVYSDSNGYDVETYIQIYNCAGFLMQVEVEAVAAIINSAKKPVMTIKPMAAGRVTPYVGLNFSWSTIRDCDMITVGCTAVDEVHEDVEISAAALEGRFPDLERRSSPNNNQAAFGKSQ
ncbi:MAG: hypothetical protein FWE91_08510 [Defluviitaleaceae bacterium]|nr:hypothetical protein [Defluviitaleaceae bacterium]MCL2835270.1 hypothetical protein [Defluviitaleaceae bacterium]